MRLRWVWPDEKSEVGVHVERCRSRTAATRRWRLHAERPEPRQRAVASTWWWSEEQGGACWRRPRDEKVVESGRGAAPSSVTGHGRVGGDDPRAADVHRVCTGAGNRPRELQRLGGVRPSAAVEDGVVVAGHRDHRDVGMRVEQLVEQLPVFAAAPFSVMSPLMTRSSAPHATASRTAAFAHSAAGSQLGGGGAVPACGLTRPKPVLAEVEVADGRDPDRTVGPSRAGCVCGRARVAIEFGRGRRASRRLLANRVRSPRHLRRPWRVGPRRANDLAPRSSVTTFSSPLGKASPGRAGPTCLPRRTPRQGSSARERKPVGATPISYRRERQSG